jgi:hypothetical protein
LTYVQGAARIDIAGNPRLDGKEYANGVWRPMSNGPANPVPMQVVQSSNGEATQATGMLQMLQTLLPMMQGGDLGGVDLPGLITAISGASSGQARERDNFRDLERMATFIQTHSQGETPAAAPAMGSMEQMIPMMFMKMMQGDGPQQQQPPYGYPQPGMNPTGGYAPPPQGWPQQQRPAPQWGYPPGMGQPPPNMPPAAGAPPGWTGPPYPGQPVQAPPQPAAAPAAPQGATPPAAARAAAGESSEDDDEHLTADDVMEDMAQMKPEERLAFVADLASKLGLPEAMAQAAVSRMPGGVPPGAEPQPPVVAPPYTVDLPGSKETT